jgi:hypothetical protein
LLYRLIVEQYLRIDRRLAKTKRQATQAAVTTGKAPAVRH